MDLATFFTPDYTLFTIPILLVAHVITFSWYHVKKKDFNWRQFPQFLKVGGLFMGFALLFNVLFTLMNSSSYGGAGVQVIDAIRLIIILGAIAYYGVNIYRHIRGCGLPSIAGIDKALEEIKEVPKEIAEKIAETVTQVDEEAETTDTPTEEPTPEEPEQTITEDNDNGDLQ